MLGSLVVTKLERLSLCGVVEGGDGAASVPVLSNIVVRNLDAAAPNGWGSGEGQTTIMEVLAATVLIPRRISMIMEALPPVP